MISFMNVARIAPMGLAKVTIFAVGLACASAHAATLREIYEAAETNDPVLGQAHASYLARKEVVPQSRSALLPTLGVGGSRQNLHRAFPGSGLQADNFLQDVWQGQLVQPVLHLNSWFQLRSANALSDQAGAEYRTAEQDLIVRTIQAFLAVLRAQAVLESAAAEEAAVKRQLEQVQQRFDVGLVAVTDVLEAQAGYDVAQVRLIQADGDHDTSFEALRVITGINYPTVDSFKADLPIVDPDPKHEDEWVQVALKSNYTIHAAEYALKASERNVRSQLASYVPEVDATASYSELDTGGRSFFGSTNTRTYALQFSVPIYRGGSVASRVREARYREEESRQQLEERRRVVESTTRGLYRAAVTDVLRVAARRHAIDSSQAALDATETGYEVGTRNIVDVLQAQQRLYLSQYDYADSRYSYVLDMMRLKQSTGTLIPDDLYELNAYMDPENPVKQLGRER